MTPAHLGSNPSPGFGGLMEIKFYNTLGRKKEVFKPLKDNEVRMYCCGPTVYDYAHIGNMRAYVFEDILRRVLEYNGFKVIHVMNITDVGHLTSDADTGEDKIEMSARKRKKSAWEIAEFFTKAFFEDAETLNILRPHIIPKATEHIQDMIELIKKIEANGYTYIIDDGVYFDTSKLKNYGILTGMTFEELNKFLKAGARVPLNPQKRNITDFALWKFSPKDVKRQMEWDSPWGVGFPGWHIECSAMSMKYLGEVFDIHCGGVDHIPIHHTNEIAQSMAATGKIPARFWLHCAHLIVEGRKMSKSLGNYYTLRDLLEKGYDWRSIRYFLLSGHYRSQLNLTFKALDAAKNTIQTLADFLRRVKSIQKEGENEEVEKIVKSMKEDFIKNVNDDLNMPKALAALFDHISTLNKMMEKGLLGKKDGEKIIECILDLDRILGLKLEEFLEEEIPEEVMKLVEERKEARKKGDYEKADRIREKIREMGYIVEDTPSGPVVKKAV